MARRVSLQATWFLPLALLGGCDVFDASLESRLLDEEGMGDAGQDAGGNMQTDAGPSQFAIANACLVGSIPKVTGAKEPLKIPVSSLASDVAESGCSINQTVLDGADGFFEIHANAGDRWHFHLDPVPGANLAVSAARSCDPRDCVAAADVCGVNESEHFTFVADRGGDYVVSVDGIDPATTQLISLLAIHPICGDGVKDHGEGCEDSDTMSGDGCDRACRVELFNNESDEVEPNDDTYLANVLLPRDVGAPIRVRAKIGGNVCQPDYFLYRVTESGKSLHAKVLTSAGTACAGAPKLELAILTSDGEELRDTSQLARVEGDLGGCPELVQPIHPGTYFLRVRRMEMAAQFDYALDITLTDPEPAQ